MKSDKVAQFHLSTHRWSFGGAKAVPPQSGTWPFLSLFIESFWNTLYV